MKTQNEFNNDRPHNMPHSSNFPKYFEGKTYKEVRDGYRTSHNWVSLKELRRFIVGGQHTTESYDKNRTVNMPSSSGIYGIYKKTFRQIRYGFKSGDRATEEEVKKFIIKGNYGYKSYNKNKKPNMPFSNKFPDIYGKTFKQLKNGFRQGDYCSKEETIKFIVDGQHSAKSYNKSRRTDMPSTSNMKRTFNITFSEARYGTDKAIRYFDRRFDRRFDRKLGIASEEEIRKFIIDGNHTYESYSKSRLSNMPATTGLRRIYGKTFKEIRDGVRATEEEVRAFIIAGDYGIALYNENRLRNMPRSNIFMDVYKKSFKELKYNVKAGKFTWVSEEELRKFIVSGNHNVKSYKLNKKYNMPCITNFQKIYSKTFRQIKEG